MEILGRYRVVSKSPTRALTFWADFGPMTPNVRVRVSKNKIRRSFTGSVHHQPPCLVSGLTRLFSCWRRPGVRASSPPSEVSKITYCTYRGFALVSTRRTMSPPSPPLNPTRHRRRTCSSFLMASTSRRCVEVVCSLRAARSRSRKDASSAFICAEEPPEQKTGDTVDTRRTIYFRAVQCALHRSLAAPSF